MSSPVVRETEQLTWRKASFCASGQCVEVALWKVMVAVRDSKDPDGPMLFYTIEEWRSFTHAVKSGSYDMFS